MPEADVRKNSWLCQYTICQLGRPYWYATSGQMSSMDLYRDVVAPAIRSSLGEYCLYSDYTDQLGVKVHDCSGLIGGALTCEGVNSAPTLSNPLNNQWSMFHADCKPNSEDMGDFPYIPGTLVFHTNSAGSKTHVGIYVGNFIDADGDSHEDEVVEAMGHAYGVTSTKIYNDKWDSWGQLSCCTIDTKKGMTFDARTSGISSTPHINVEATTPFIATLSQSYQLDLDYDKIKKARISGMSFFGGELFDINHNKRTYLNPNLPKLVQQCNDGGLPYALYVNVRSRNAIEADAECRTLYYILAGYPPKLGVWLSLKTNNTKEMNNTIIEIYYKYLERWGFKDKCGFYIDKSDLTKFSWTSFQDRFLLWLIEPMSVTSVDDELLQPEMFEVPD